MANKKLYTDLFPFMVGDLPGILNDKHTLLQHIRQAAREFCNRSEVWRTRSGVDFGPFNLESDEKDYYLDWDWCTEIRRVVEVRQNTEDGISQELEGAVVNPDGYELREDEDNGQLALLEFLPGYIPSNSVTNGLEIEVIFVPLLDSCDLPEWLYNRWFEAIRFLATSTLAGLPKKDWTNQVIEAKFYNRYMEKLNQTLIENEKKYKGEQVGFSA